jgi:hypothetical protein
MAVTVESFAANSTAGNNDVTITFPGTYTPLEDDIIFLWCGKNAVGLTYTNASPWVEVQTGGFAPSDDSMRVSVIYRVVTAGEESGGTLTYDASNVWSANSAGATIGVALRGVDTAAIIDSFGTTDQATTGTSHSLAGLTGANLSTGSLVLSGIFADGAGASDYAEPTDWGTVQLNASQMRSAVFSLDAATTASVDVDQVAITGPGDEFVSVTVAFTAAGGGATDLVVADHAVTVAMDAVVLTQVHTLAVADHAVDVVMDNVALTQVHQLVVADHAVDVVMDNVTLTQVHNLTVADHAVTVVIDNVVLTQVHELVVADHAVTVVIDNVVLDPDDGESDLVVEDLTIVVVADNVALTQVHSLVVADMTIVVAADNVTLGVPQEEVFVRKAVHATLSSATPNTVTLTGSHARVQIINHDATEPLSVFYTTTGGTPETASADADNSFVVPPLAAMSVRVTGTGFVASIVGDGNAYSVVGYDNVADQALP